MAIDQESPKPTTVPSVESIIDNEVPAYRAISSAAIWSIVLAVVSIFCYASLYFLVAVAISVILGVSALRKIKRYPEILTGAGYARAGIGLSLLFGLTSVTYAIGNDQLTNYDASKFARMYAKLIKEEDGTKMELWYQQPPQYRTTKTPTQIEEELKNAHASRGPDPFVERTRALLAIKDKLKKSGGDLHFSKIESKAEAGLDVYAFALLELDGNDPKDQPGERHALLRMVRNAESARGDWVISEVTYPYIPASEVAVAPSKSDDGHGH